MDQCYKITRAVAQQWQGFTRQTGEDQFTDLAILKAFSCLGINHLRVKVILVNMQPLVL